MHFELETASLVLSFSLCIAASAAVKEFPKFSVDVPAGWSASEQDGTVILMADDKTASVSITRGDTDGASFVDLAKAFAKELKGTEPQEQDGVYVFTFNGGASTAILGGEGKEYALMVMSGKSDKFEAIMGSIKDK